MRRVVLQAWLLLALFIVDPLTAFAKAEEILQFDSRILVRTNGSMQVTETIRVRSRAAKIRHGIYRDFPQEYSDRWGLRMQTGFDVLSVTRDGLSESYHTENRANGTRCYLGSASVELPPGTYTYEVIYETDNQLGFFKDHDELFWNVTGNGWIFPVRKVTATVTLPAGAEPGNLEAYTGRSGAKGKDFTALVVDGRPTFQTTRVLRPAEGLTIVVPWPKGFVTRPPAWHRLTIIAKANHVLALGVAGLLLTLLYYLAVWAWVGKDPKPGTIIPLYDAPRGFSPAAVSYLARMGFDDRALTATILNLAVKGKLTIREYQDKAYTLFRTDEATRGLADEEIGLLSRLFEDGPRLALIEVNHLTLQEAKTILKERLAKMEEKIYFARNLLYWVPGFLLTLAWVVFLMHSAAADTATAPFLSVCVLVADVILLVLFYHLLKAPTSTGRRILDQIEGFKLYLSVAEKDRLNLENPPERTPALFERFLPYALALGVEQKWAEQFAAVLAAAGQDRDAYSPSWYSGHSWSDGNLDSLTSSMSDSLSGAIASASASPGSSSGSGGGGSSGGGGGGGGGGGW